MKELKYTSDGYLIVSELYKCPLWKKSSTCSSGCEHDCFFCEYSDFRKPEYLLEKIVLASTEEGQVILDPFCGSGTTGVEAVRFGRKFIGIDVSEEYLEISKRRLEKVYGDAKEY